MARLRVIYGEADVQTNGTHVCDSEVIENNEHRI